MKKKLCRVTPPDDPIVVYSTISRVIIIISSAVQYNLYTCIHDTAIRHFLPEVRVFIPEGLYLFFAEHNATNLFSRTVLYVSILYNSSTTTVVPNRPLTHTTCLPIHLSSTYMGFVIPA